MYNCSSVWAAPQAPENTTKTNIATINTYFRPRISLDFAQTTRKPIQIQYVGYFKMDFEEQTSICDLVRRDYPSGIFEPIEVVCNGNKGSRYDSSLHIRNEYAKAYTVKSIKFWSRKDILESNSRQKQNTKSPAADVNYHSLSINCLWLLSWFAGTLLCSDLGVFFNNHISFLNWCDIFYFLLVCANIWVCHIFFTKLIPYKIFDIKSGNRA